jgi:hypothetical protein
MTLEFNALAVHFIDVRIARCKARTKRRYATRADVALNAETAK